jgi:hypothetical protein
MTTIQEMTDFVVKMIDEDINSDYANGRTPPMPWNASTFSDLHDFIDANEYVLQADEHFGFLDTADEAIERGNRVTDAVTEILSARVDNLKPIFQWDRGVGLPEDTVDCLARVLYVPWLTSHAYLLWWTDGVAQEETERFEALSEAVVALGALIRCGESDWTKGFDVLGSEMADVIGDFFGKAVS